MLDNILKMCYSLLVKLSVIWEFKYMKMKTEEMYASMAPWRLFFVVALPGMVSMFAMSIYSIIEGIFIGQVLGESAFAAVNIAFPLVNLFP